MNAFVNSECSSGCESGWTLYLENASKFIGGGGSEGGFYDEEQNKEKRGKDHDESSGEEDDLSMISDASSGPPHFAEHEAYFNQENNACFNYSASKTVKNNIAKSGTKRRVKEKQNIIENQHLPSFLHDTASSPFFESNVTETDRQTLTGSMVDYSQGFSATYFEGRSSYQEGHYGFLQPSLSENNELRGNKWYGGKGMR